METLPVFDNLLWKMLADERIQRGYERLSQSVLSALQQYKTATFEELLSFVHLNDKQLALIVWRLLEEKKIIKSCDGRVYELPKHSQETYKDNLGLSSCERKALSPTLHHHLDESLRRDQKLQRAFEKFKMLAKGRPDEKTKYKQRHVTLRSSFIRALYMLSRGDIAYKSVLLIGDDDLTSLALRLLEPSVKLVILEIDEALLHFLEEQGQSLPNKCVYWAMDVDKSWDTSLNGSFSTVFCDPSKDVYDLFLQRAREALNPLNGVLYTCICQTYSRDKSDQELFSKLVAQGFYITDIIPQFVSYNRYRSSLSPEFDTIIPHPKPGQDSICFKESLLRAEMQEISESPTLLQSQIKSEKDQAAFWYGVRAMLQSKRQYKWCNEQPNENVIAE
jgi:predicted methyltransferase